MLNKADRRRRGRVLTSSHRLHTMLTSESPSGSKLWSTPPTSRATKTRQTNRRNLIHTGHIVLVQHLNFYMYSQGSRFFGLTKFHDISMIFQVFFFSKFPGIFAGWLESAN